MTAKIKIRHDFVPKIFDILRSGKYSWRFFGTDIFTGITIAVITIPLSMAFGIAAGLTPERGLYTSIVAGFIIALLSGGRFQIGGPTGVFVVISYTIIQASGYEGLAAATLVSGVILLIAAFSRLGSWIKYIPYPMIAGFITGIAVNLFTSQIKDFFGLTTEKVPPDFISKWIALIKAMPTIDLTTFFFSLGSLLVIVFIRRFIPIVPWGITTVVVATAISWGFDLPLETIYSKFGEFKREFPFPSLPDMADAFSDWKNLVPNAFTLAFLTAVEALIAAVVADGLAGTRHKSNCELMAQGTGNIFSIFWGGIPATAAIARTATNVKIGAKSPISGMCHSIALLLILLAFAPYASRIPLAVLAAVLIMVAWNMAEVERFRHLFKAPAGDVAVMLITFFLTLLTDLAIAAAIGIILASFLFMKRMVEISRVVSFDEIEKIQEGETPEKDGIEKKHIPDGIEVYEINGPFFFGVADSLKDVLDNFEFPPKVFILRMRKVPVVDASGMHALKDFYYKCQRQNTILLLSGVNRNVLHVLKKYGIIDLIGKGRTFSKIDQALNYAEKIVEK